MFEVKFIVADPTLHKALRALGNLPIEPPVVIPVDEANAPHTVGVQAVRDTLGTLVQSSVRRKRRRNKNPTGPYKATRHGKVYALGGAARVIKDKLVAMNTKRITAEEMREWMPPNGYTRAAYSYAATKLIKTGFLRRTGEFGVYEVLQQPQQSTEGQAA